MSRTMMRDIFLLNIEDYSSDEIAQAIKEGIVRLDEVESAIRRNIEKGDYI